MVGFLGELTRFRARERDEIVAKRRGQAFRIVCRSCGTGAHRSGAWVEAHPVFMCGHCFQDNGVSLANVLNQSGALDGAPLPPPLRLAGDLPPLSLR